MKLSELRWTREPESYKINGGDRDETPYGFVAENVLSFSER